MTRTDPVYCATSVDGLEQSREVYEWQASLEKLQAQTVRPKEFWEAKQRELDAAIAFIETGLAKIWADYGVWKLPDDAKPMLIVDDTAAVTKRMGYNGVAKLSFYPEPGAVTGLEGKRLGDPCGICGTKLGVLFSGLYCVKGCDTPASVDKRAKEDEERMKRIADWNMAMAQSEEDNSDSNAKTWPGP